MSYCEMSEKNIMMLYSCFTKKLKKIQSITEKIHPSHINKNINKQSLVVGTNCKKCQNDFFYKFGDITWPKNLLHKIKDHHLYPSDYFIKIIMGCCIINNYIVNPPIQIEPRLIKSFMYIPFHRNKLLIIDALMQQGSYPRYSTIDKKYIYSEHSGVVSLKNYIIDNIIVSAETNRINANDNDIYLPINTDLMKNHEFLFHTHPNTITYAGRLKDGVIYEFPSANDILNFIKYRTIGIAQASIIAAPEGMYVVRPIIYKNKSAMSMKQFHKLSDFIIELENKAIEKFHPFINRISDPNYFHKNIASNMLYIKKYNKFIEPLNLFIEYYPREKINGEWCLRPFNLCYIEPQSN